MRAKRDSREDNNDSSKKESVKTKRPGRGNKKAY